jgi:hypothetical protein
MQNTVVIGRRLIPTEHIALVEPFDQAALERLESERPFQTRLVLLDRSSVLTEEALEAFADEHGFKKLAGDGIAMNPAVAFKVEAFEASGEFQPSKPYRSRLLWRDQSGNTQSRLMIAEPQELLAVAVRSAASKQTSRSRSLRKGSNPSPG